MSLLHDLQDRISDHPDKDVLKANISLLNALLMQKHGISEEMMCAMILKQLRDERYVEKLTVELDYVALDEAAQQALISVQDTIS